MDIMDFLAARIHEEECDLKEMDESSSYDIGKWSTERINRARAEIIMKQGIIAHAGKLLASGEYEGWRGTGKAILRTLAAVYADHPDYKSKWAS